MFLKKGGMAGFDLFNDLQLAFTALTPFVAFISAFASTIGIAFAVRDRLFILDPNEIVAIYHYLDIKTAA